MFTMTFCFPGTLTANIVPKFKLERKSRLLHVSAVASNDSDATLKIGNQTNDAAYLVAGPIGDSGVPIEKKQADFVGANYPTIDIDTTMVLTLDYDGASGTAAQNVTIVLTFRPLKF